MNSTTPIAGPSATARLERGAVVLLVIFWMIHLAIMLVRAELNDQFDEVSFFESLMRRGSFALFGALLGYILYRGLRLLSSRSFLGQVTIGALLALITAIVQAIGNSLIFVSDPARYFSTLLFSLLYWFWFYFCWTTAYLAFTYSIRVKEQERHAAELSVIAQEAQMRALRYQISPHFLFNTLNAIAALVRDAPAQAEQMVVQLSEFFRRTLAVNPMEDLTLAEEVELQRLYLEIERTRFPDRLRFEVAIDDDVATAKVPALLLQPLVENAVKHGVARSETPSAVRIRASIDTGVLEIVVENDALASGNAIAGERVGLRNVRERLRSRYGHDAVLVAENVVGGGFRNIVHIPLLR